MAGTDRGNTVKIKNYVKPASLEEAWELNQKRSARLIGGMMWLRTGRQTIATAVDLTGLGLNEIEETEEEFRIGAMVTLRQLELHPGLAAYTGGAMREAVRSIVGVQFRNLATVGGSIWGRFGFSDVLTLFLALDTRVLLYRAGEMSLWEFAGMKKDNDILTGLTVRKRPQKTAYLAYRNTKTDFPVLTCAMALARRQRRRRFSGNGRGGGKARKSDLPGTAGELPGRPYPGRCGRRGAVGADRAGRPGDGKAGAHGKQPAGRRGVQKPPGPGAAEAEPGTASGSRERRSPVMTIKLTLNGRPVTAQIEDGMTLYEFVRSRGCCSVKCGCETSNCGLCTVFLNDLPVLSCSVLAAPGGRMQGGYSGGAAGRGGGVWRLYRGPGSGAVRLLQSRHGDERHCSVPGEPRLPPMRRSKNIWREISAAAPAMRDSCGESMLLWSIKKEVPAHEKREDWKRNSGSWRRRKEESGGLP